VNQPLEDLRIVELSAFVAAPLGGMTMAQMGAEVIRIDPIGGGIDIRRWPVAANGMSLYWAGLNKEKRSVALALDRPEGRELAHAIITAPGAGGGIVLTNLPPSRGLDFASLKAARGDLIMLRLVGNRDGSAAVDYTVNAASGFPLVTGAGGGPVNHVLPAWDIAAGLYLATGLLAAERYRTRTGAGQEVVAALADVMLATVGNLGYVGDVHMNGRARPALGNDLYGSFDRDFATADGRRVMIIALTSRQWQALGRATGLGERLQMIGPMMDVDLDTEEGRYAARDAISALLGRWISFSWCATTRAARPPIRSLPRSSSRGSGVIRCRGCRSTLPPYRAGRRARRRCSANTPTACSPSCSACARPKSAGCTTPASPPVPTEAESL
jgi:2-methylfumaryl-CoA isomerase